MENEYLLHAIRSRRTRKHGYEYWVQWVGDHENTWELGRDYEKMDLEWKENWWMIGTIIWMKDQDHSKKEDSVI